MGTGFVTLCKQTHKTKKTKTNKQTNKQTKQSRGRALPNDSTQSLALQNPLHHTLGQVQMAAAQKQCKKVQCSAVSNPFSMANVIMQVKFNLQPNFALQAAQASRLKRKQKNETYIETG